MHPALPAPLRDFIQHHLLAIYPSPDNSDCPICFEPYEPINPALVISEIPGCPDHHFHAACLLRWVMTGEPTFNSCPVCRTEYFPCDMPPTEVSSIAISFQNEKSIRIMESVDEGHFKPLVNLEIKRGDVPPLLSLSDEQVEMKVGEELGPESVEMTGQQVCFGVLALISMYAAYRIVALFD